MTHSVTRRIMCLGTAVLGAALVAGAGGAQSGKMQGYVPYAGGKVIPQGQIEIFLDGSTSQGRTQSRIKSDGRSRQIAFSLTPPARADTSQPLRLVAHLEREDGWLLARGSAQIKAGLPVSITLNTVMY